MSRHVDHPFSVGGTELHPDDPPRVWREKIARVTFDSMVQLVGILDTAGTVIEINQVALRAVGLQHEDVAGKPLWETFWWQVSKEINETVRESIRRASLGEVVRWDTEIYGRAGGKETIVIDCSFSPIFDSTGRVVFICCEGRDITEKKEREREIAQKSLELQGLLERIRELDEIKTQFFANVSHELRTPLALILGPAQRLIDDASAGSAMSPAQRLEAAHLVARNARLLLKHVNDLLDLSRIEARKLKIELQATDVAALLRFVASHFAVLAQDRGITFEVLAEEPCAAAVDPDKLQRVLMNLLGNAFKFVPDGGHVRCGLQASDGSLRLFVDDSGPGVPPALRRAVFERFRQVDGGASRKAGGTGLGLAIAKEFVEMHQGQIEVLESPLGGARFEVALPHLTAPGSQLGAPGPAPLMPLAPGLDASALHTVVEELRFARAVRSSDSAPPPSPPPAASSSSSLSSALSSSPSSSPSPELVPSAAGEAQPRARVLVVEDNPDMNRFVAQCLRRFYEVETAFDGREGVAKTKAFRPTLIVSDIMMPGMSGVEMIAELRGHPELAATPILLLSAKADEELMIQLLNDGVQDFIVKPFSERELVVRARNLVVAQQTREQVSRLRDAAEAASRAKDEFFAMLGHELRNPLAPILSALELIGQQAGTAFERERSVISRQVDHLSRLVDDLLDVSRIAGGKVELKRAPVELARVVDEALEPCRILFTQRRHQLELDVAAGLLVHADSTRLVQVVSNLLTNAAKYTPPGGRVTVRGQGQGDQVELVVKDSGIGISPEILPRVFDLFVQEPQAIDRAQGGLGLGLAIVRGLVEQHGGTVAAHSDGIGRGAEVTVRLPALSAEAARQEPSAAGARVSASRAPLRVLIVDDNEDAADMLAEMLSRRGYLARSAHDPGAALRLAAELLPDVAFLDIGLPGMTGYELAARLRQLPGLAAVELVALTGYGQESDRQRAKEAGFHHHLVKPVGRVSVEQILIQRGKPTLV